jgi:hypothetical protein
VTNADGSPLMASQPYFLKTLAALFNNPEGLQDMGAHPENTLLVNDSSYKNIKNNMWNAVHPTIFIASHPDRSKEYLDHELRPWLRHLKDSG